MTAPKEMPRSVPRRTTSGARRVVGAAGTGALAVAGAGAAGSVALGPHASASPTAPPAARRTNSRRGGDDVPMLVNLLATRRRYGLALGCAPAETQHTWNRAVAQPLPPVLVESGPCQEVVLLGDDADVTRFPIPRWNALDGGHYLT